jgi:ribosomal-protein-alanine N-acetyltransferase
MFSIKRLDSTHLFNVLAIEQHAQQFPWTLEMLTSSLSSGALMWGAFEKSTQQLLGFLLVSYVVDEAEVLTISVHPLSQHKGVGLCLMNKVLRSLHHDFCVQHVFLEVRVDNISAISFYEKLGFERMGVRRQYYPDGQDALCYRLTIEKFSQKINAL